jgi:hypothetical protein
MGSARSISFPAMHLTPSTARRLLLAAGIFSVFLAGCTVDKDPAAPRVDPLIGSYRLETINGGAIGVVSFVPDSIRYFADVTTLDYDTLVTTVRWERDSFDLRDGGRYSNRLAYRLITDTVRNGVTSGDTLSNDAVYHGSWSRSPVGHLLPGVAEPDGHHESVVLPPPLARAGERLRRLRLLLQEAVGGTRVSTSRDTARAPRR